MKNIAVTKLSNGLTVATDNISHVDSISLGLWVDVGARQELAEHNGVAHLLEHMVFKGTARRSALDIAVEIENVGGYLNAHTGREQTAYYARLLVEDWRLAMDMIADLIQYSTFLPDQLEKERDVVIQEIGQAEDNPEDIIFDYFQEIAFPAQSIGRPILGSAELVAGLDRASLLAFRDNNYSASRMILAGAGKIQHDEFCKAAEKLFPLGGFLQPRADHSDQPAYRGGIFVKERDLEQVHLVYGFEGVSLKDDDYYATALLSQILGGGMSSRLFQEIREKRGLAYSIGSFSNAYIDTGLFGIYAGIDPAKADIILPLIREELERVKVDLHESELRRAAQQFKSAILMGREKTANRCEQLANQLQIYGRPIGPAEIAQKIDRVTESDIRRMADRIFSGATSLVVLGDRQGVKPFAGGEMA